MIYLTILGESWFRGDFNISYRYVNRPGPDGDKMNLLIPLQAPSDNLDSKTSLIIIVVSSSVGGVCLFILALSCIGFYLRNKRKKSENPLPKILPSPSS